MHRGKKIGRKKSASLQTLPPEKEGLLLLLLKEYKDTSPENVIHRIPSPLAAEILVRRLPDDDPATIPLIQALRDSFSQKGVQKAIKKARARLKQGSLYYNDRR